MLQNRQAGGNATKTGADCLDGQFQQHHRCRADEQCHDVTRNPFYVAHEYDDHSQGRNRKSCLQERERREIVRDGLETTEKITGNFFDF